MKSPFFFQQPSTRGEHMAYHGTAVATAIDESNDTEVTLSVCEINMLMALARMDRKNPGRRNNYPDIHDDVFNFTKGKVDLDLKEMRTGKVTLMEHDLIKDGGIGFTITPIGITFASENALP